MKAGSDVRCFGLAWVSGWAVAVFLPSALIAWMQLPGALDLRRLAADTWHVADAMAPGAKLLLGGLLLVGFVLADRLSRGRRTAVLVLVSAAAAVVAMLLTLLLIPAEWSRGFGIGLTGVRLSSGLVPLYLGGAVVAGMVRALGVVRCRAALLGARG